MRIFLYIASIAAVLYLAPTAESINVSFGKLGNIKPPQAPAAAPAPAPAPP